MCFLHSDKNSFYRDIRFLFLWVDKNSQQPLHGAGEKFDEIWVEWWQVTSVLVPWCHNMRAGTNNNIWFQTHFTAVWTIVVVFVAKSDFKQQWKSPLFLLQDQNIVTIVYSVGQHNTLHWGPWDTSKRVSTMVF